MINHAGKLSALILLLSAVAVIYSSYINRQLAYEWQALGVYHDELKEDYGRLMLEYSTLAAPSRIEMMARKKLNMDFPNKLSTKVIRLNVQ